MAYDPTTKTFTVFNETDLNQAIANIDAVGKGGQLAGGAYTIRLAQDIMLGGPASGNVKDADGTSDLMVNGGTVGNSVDLKAINLSDGTTLTIDGGTHTIDGAGATRGLFVYNGAVSIHDLTIANTLAEGGSGAGGGAGLGGGLFVAGPNPTGLGSQTTTQGGVVTLTNVTFTDNKAQGGAGSNDNLGGGGLGGDGGHNGGGGVGLGATGARSATSGDAAATGGPGIIVGAASGGSGTPIQPGQPGFGSASAGPGGRSGGGGGAVGRKGAAAGGGGGVNGSFQGTRDGFDGTGGFGGGGSAAAPKGGAAGLGGFGGGGGFTPNERGANIIGGSGGFGGGGGAGFSLSAGGFGAGNGSGFAGAGQNGGGGLGAGGAIFVQEGGKLILGGNVNIGGGAVTPGASPGNDGQAFASGIYMQGNNSLDFATSDPTTGAPSIQTISDVIGDDRGSAAAAGYTFDPTRLVLQSPYTPGITSVNVSGGGTLIFDAVNTYAGTTTLSGTASLIGATAGAFSVASAFVVGLGTSLILNADQTIASLADGPTGGGTVSTFLSSSTLTLGGVATARFSGSIVDSLALVKQGKATQTLAGNNSYSGGTKIVDGVLDVAATTAAGTGNIAFNAAANAFATLRISSAADAGNGGTFFNTLDDFGSSDALDLRAIAYQDGATATVDAGVLTVTSGGRSESFKLGGNSGSSFGVADDGNGGTLVGTITTGLISYQTGGSYNPLAIGTDVPLIVYGGTGLAYSVTTTTADGRQVLTISNGSGASQQVKLDADAAALNFDFSSNTAAVSLTGGDFGDNIRGGSVADMLNGGAGNDTLEGGAGADRIDGGAGIDTASYEHALTGVTANLGTPSQNTGDAAGDTYFGIENLTGSAFADRLTGDDGPFRNVIEGLGGADTITGVGVGDIASYLGSTQGVNVNLETNVNTGGDALGDTLTGIQNIYGSLNADSLTGNGNANLLYGQGGADTLDGMGGNDKLFVRGNPNSVAGGDGIDQLQLMGGGRFTFTNANFTGIEGVVVNSGQTADFSGISANGTLITSRSLVSGAGATIVGGSGADRIKAGAAGDTITGGAGNDVLSAGAGSDTFNYGASGFGRDVAYGVDLASDHIRFTSGPNDFGDLLITASGANSPVATSITIKGQSQADAIVLRGVAADDVTAAFFQFGAST